MPAESNQSPNFRKPVKDFSIHEESSPSTDAGSSQKQSLGTAMKKNNAGAKLHIGDVALPLTTSRMANTKAKEWRVEPQDLSVHESSSSSSSDDRSSVAKFRGTDAAKYIKDSDSPVLRSFEETNARSGDRFGVIGQGRRAQGQDTPGMELTEIESLRKQLAAANYKIAAMDQELSQQTIPSNSINQVLQSPSDSEFKFKDATDELISKLTHFPVPYTQANLTSLMSSLRVADQSEAPWTDAKRGPTSFNTTLNQVQPNTTMWSSNVPNSWSSYDSRGTGLTPRMANAPQPQRPNNLRLDTWSANQHYHQGMAEQGFDQNSRRGLLHSGGGRPGSAMGESCYHGNVPYPASIPATPLGYSPPLTPMHMQQMNMMPQVPTSFSQRSASNGLSPVALEFNGNALQSMSSLPQNAWNNQNAGADSTSGYMLPMEPMNYRKLLDRNMSCNWKYIVDKIVCSNDQQASIFLQQKLKISSTDQKYELVNAIIAQAYPLMINRFGNFLVQRCFEHGTPDQVIEIANAIRGNTLNLSMDPFGCHVVQKAFDVVPEDYKAIMVHELLCRIPETVIHRYACHVWQKLFELRWSDSPPQIMKYVNEALRGMWHEVALGETGSLVVQNIFENCLEEDKRPCINEVLASIDIIAHGQFGNWCIQHICEHGLPADKSRAIEHVLRFATEYSTDQFASKVVEKCLKIGGSEFIDRYLERVCEGRADRPRMPLIDIAGDQYGNYLVQYILIHANPQHRDIVSTHVRKHMVSLRGSKFGSRVAMLCSNPAVSTRPGPPAGMQMNNRFLHGVGMNRTSMSGPYR